MYTGCAPPAAPAVGNNRRPLPAIGGRFGLRPVSSYTDALPLGDNMQFKLAISRKS